MIQNDKRLIQDLEIEETFFVRDMKKGDIVDILALQDRIFREDSFDPRWFYPFSKKELEEFLGEETGISVGAFMEGKLVAFRTGCISGEEYDEITRALGSPYTETDCFLMNGAFVEKAYRGNHLQQMLTEQCIARCMKRGIGTFLAVVHPDNFSSMKSLKNIGFTERSRQKLFDGNYDRIILVHDTARPGRTEG